MRAILIVAVAAIGFAGGSAAEGIEPKAAFAALKELAGEGSGLDGIKVAYKVTAGGSVVMETMFPGEPHEMVSMYHLDGDTLRMTHDCGAGNQPRTKLDARGSKPGHLVFQFDGGTSFDPAKDAHMHEGRIKITDAKHIEAEWDGYAGGKKSGTHTFTLTRP